MNNPSLRARLILFLSLITGILFVSSCAGGTGGTGGLENAGPRTGRPPANLLLGGTKTEDVEELASPTPTPMVYPRARRTP